MRFKGAEKTNVAEYCISEGWIRVEAGKTKDRHGKPLTIKLAGPVEVFFKDEKTASPTVALLIIPPLPFARWPSPPSPRRT